MARKTKSKKSKNRLICVILFAVLVAAYIFGLGYENKIDEVLGLRKIETYQAGDRVVIGSMNIHFIDVGQGDACLIELPDNRSMLIDAGENRNSVKTALFNYMEKVNDLREEQNKTKITYFDYAIATHSDSDHIGSMAYILDIYPARVFYRPNEKATYTGFTDPAINGVEQRHKFREDGNGEKNTKTYMNAIEAGYKPNSLFTPEGIVTNPNDNTQNKIAPSVSPNHDLYYEINFYGNKSASYSDHNNYSPIIILEYKDRRIALSGDAEAKGEQEFVELATEKNDPRYNVFDSNFCVDIIKLGHHGSRTSSSVAYLNILLAAKKNMTKDGVYAVISCGEGNSYRHPHSEVLTRIYDEFLFLSDNVYRTDTYGSIFFALVYQSGSDRAAISFEGNLLPSAEYTHVYYGITIRYRLIGIVVLVIMGLFLLPTASLIREIKKLTTGSSNTRKK